MKRIPVGEIGCREIDRDGYIRVYAPHHPWQRGRMLAEHILIIERHLGRRLSGDECVHHKDENKHNNTLGNLELKSRGVHSRHHRLREDPILRRHPRKLTATAVARIRLLLAAGWSQSRIGKEFGVSQTLISRISLGKIWMHVSS